MRRPWPQEGPDQKDLSFYTGLDRDPALLLYQIEPAAHLLEVGDTCQVGIPPTIVYVIDIVAPETAMPSALEQLRVARAGLTYGPWPSVRPWTITPQADLFISVDFLFRPYAFLEAGDEFADRYGQVWRFEEPWDWRRVYAGGSTSAPVWPLVLLTLDGPPGRAAKIRELTSTGTHEDEIARWRPKPGPDLASLRSHP